MESIEKRDVMVYMKILKFPYKFWHCGPEKEFFIYAHEWRGYYTFCLQIHSSMIIGSLYLRGHDHLLFSQKTIILLTILVLLLKLRELPYLPLYGVTRQSCQAILATHGLAKSNLQSYLTILEKKFATKNVDAQAAKRTRSPPIPSAYEVSQENSHLSRNDKIQAVLEAGVCPRLVELLLYVPICFILLHYDIDFKFVLILALRTMGNIVNGDDAQTQMSLVIDSPVHSSSSEDFAAFLDAELNSTFDISPDLDGEDEDEDEDKDDDEDDSKPNIERLRSGMSSGRWDFNMASLVEHLHLAWSFSNSILCFV